MSTNFEQLGGWAADHPDRIPFAQSQPTLAQAAPFLYQDAPPASVLLYKAIKDANGGQYIKYPAQQIGDCFPANTLVTMADGTEKPIEQIVVGDMVVNAKNKPCKVKRTIAKPFSGKMVTIQAEGYARKVTATADHRFKHIPGDTTSKAYGKKTERLPEFQWTPIDFIEEKTRVLIPWGPSPDSESDPVIDLLQFLPEAKVDGDKQLDLYGTCALAVMPELSQKTERMEKLRLTYKKLDVTEYGLALPVKSREETMVENTTVYCIEVEEDASFIANGYGVHNCCSWGSGHVADLIECTRIALQKLNEEFHEICTEALYGVGREIAGMLGSGDGCYGGAMAKAVTQVGTIDRKSVGAYSGQRAKDWGRTGTPKEIKAKMVDHKVKSFALLTSTGDLVAALANLNPAIICSDQGFTMTRDANGLCYPKGSWGHCMHCCGYRTRNGDIEFCIGQSWGPNVPSGPLSDDQPDYTFWIQSKVMAQIISQQDSWAFCGIDGWAGTAIPPHWTVGGFAS